MGLPCQVLARLLFEAAGRKLWVREGMTGYSAPTQLARDASNGIVCQTMTWRFGICCIWECALLVAPLDFIWMPQRIIKFASRFTSPSLRMVTQLNGRNCVGLWSINRQTISLIGKLSSWISSVTSAGSDKRSSLSITNLVWAVFWFKKDSIQHPWTHASS